MDNLIKKDVPVWQITLKDLSEVIARTVKEQISDSIILRENTNKYVRGISGLAELLGCSKSTANRLKASGILDPAIKQVGRIIIVDSELALQLISNQKERRRRK